MDLTLDLTYPLRSDLTLRVFGLGLGLGLMLVKCRLGQRQVTGKVIGTLLHKQAYITW